MKQVFVIGDLNDKLKRVLDLCVKDKLIYNYVNYEIYNNIHKKANEEMHLLSPSLTNDEFCEMFIHTSKDIQREWIILKGDIHTKEFLKILIGFEKGFDPLNKSDLFLSHITEIVDKEGRSFCLSDGALNTKQLEDKEILGKIIKNAQEYVLNKKEGISRIDPTIITAIVLAADNSNVPGYEVAKWFENHASDVVDTKNIEIKQFDECFDATSWALKHKTEDLYSFSIPDVVITPDITVGNCIWKSLTILNDYFARGYVVGGKLKTILLSRSDSEQSYYESIKGVCNEN